MTLNPCAGCGKVKPGKPVTIYAAYNNAGVRNSFKGTWCLACAQAEFKALMECSIDANDDEALLPETCPICGTDLDSDPAITNASTFRGKDRRDLRWYSCAGCAPVIRNKLTEGADPLASRHEFDDSGDGWGRPQSSPTPEKVAGLPW